MHRRGGDLQVRDQSEKAQAEEAEHDWEHLWKPILFKEDGSLDVEQLKKEMADFGFMIREVPRVYSHVTGGLLSKPNYFADTVIAEHDDHVGELVRDHEMEIRENLWMAHACQFYKAGEKKKGDVWSCEACAIDFKTDEFEDIVWSSVESRKKAIEASVLDRAADLAEHWMKHNQSLVIPSLRAEAACRKPGYKPDGTRLQPCLDPDKMHGAGDGFGGTDYPDVQL